jgi:predicted Zn-dependent protease
MFSIFSRAPRALRAVAAAGSIAVAGGCASMVSTQQEVELGQQAAAEANAQLPVVRDASVNSYINQLGRSISQRVDPRGIQYTFRVVNSNEVNAFSLPGGYVYVNSGLIARASNASELAGVLSHEIGHVVERHSVEQMERAQGANLLAAILLGNASPVAQAGAQIGGQALFAHYSRDAEREADADAVRFMVQSGYDPRGLVTMFQTLLAEEQTQPSAVQGWFSTHPLTQERVQNVEQEIARIPASTLRGLKTNTSAYNSFRARVRSGVR